MTALNFKEQFADDVENGTKRQTIRGINCLDTECARTLPYPQCIFQGDRQRVARCYQPKIKVGDTLQLYTGMMQKNYCTNKDSIHFQFNVGDYIKSGRTCACELPNIGPKTCNNCSCRGAKLLKTATCTESFPIRFEDLTEEIARLDGFVYIPFGEKTRYGQSLASPLFNLKDFLIKEYNAKDGDVFQIIRW